MTYIEWQKKFVAGEQNTIYNEATQEMWTVDRTYYWQKDEVYNLIGPFVRSLEKEGYKGIWGKKGIVEQLIPYQRKYNKLENQLATILNQFVNPVLIVEDGSVDTDELSEDGLAPGKILVYRQGGHEPSFARAFTSNEVSLIASLVEEAKKELLTVMDDIKNQIFLDSIPIKKGE